MSLINIQNIKNWLLLSKKNITNNKKLRLLIVCILQTILFKAQIANYITNGGFEQVYNCSSFDHSINNAKGWRSIDSSVFGGLVLNTVCYSYVPNNGLTYQWPHSGNNDIQTTVLCQTPQCSPYPNRGYFRNRLKANLINGKTYCVKAYVNVSDPSTNGISNIGFFFVDNSIDTITKISAILSYINPQVENPATNILTDTMNWVSITGTFVANGNEKNCVIGNFRTDVATTKTLINSTYLPTIGCDILIDDVSCIPIDLPAYAGADIWAMPGNTVYIGRPQDVGIDEACIWYNLTNTTTPIANAAGFSLTVSAVTATYMVKQDICGVIKYDTIVVHASSAGLAQQEIIKNNFNVYPNPTKNELNIAYTIDGLENYNQVLIFNNLGQLIKEEEIVFKDKNAKVNVSSLQNGAYFLSLKNQNLFTVNKRFIIAN